MMTRSFAEPRPVVSMVLPGKSIFGSQGHILQGVTPAYMVATGIVTELAFLDLPPEETILGQLALGIPCYTEREAVSVTRGVTWKHKLTFTRNIVAMDIKASRLRVMREKQIPARVYGNMRSWFRGVNVQLLQVKSGGEYTGELLILDTSIVTDIVAFPQTPV